MDDYYPHFEKIRPQLTLMTDMKDPTDTKTLTVTFITIDSEKHNDSIRFAPTQEEINNQIQLRFTGLDRKKVKAFATEKDHLYDRTEHHLTLFYIGD